MINVNSTHMHVYAIASRFYGDEYLVVIIQEVGTGPLVSRDVDGLVKFFQPFYDILSGGQDTPGFAECGMKLAALYPVIIKLNESTAMNDIQMWRDGGLTYIPETLILPMKHGLFKMKAGFIEAFKELDILRDIEQKLTVGADGKIGVNVFTVVYSHKGEKADLTPMDEEAINRVLRQRGLK